MSLILAFGAAQRPGCYSWLIATSLCMGVTVAAKYNAFPVLILIPFIPFRWVQTGTIPRSRAISFTITSLLIAGIGFVGATPELLWRPDPWIAGLRFELAHYHEGHIPHQAYDWEDNNLFYWSRYMVWLGFGWLALLFSLLFIVRIIRLRRREDFLLGIFLMASTLLVFATKVRFERNLEICLGPLALAAGASAWDFFCWMKKRQNPVYRRILSPVFIALWFFQPFQVLYHFHETLDYPRQLRARLDGSILRPGPVIYIHLPTQALDAAVTGYSQVVLVNYGDPFSAGAEVRWRQLLGFAPSFTLISPWAMHGYPFSTVDVYHGPQRILVFERSTNSTSVAPSDLVSTPGDGK